MGHGGGHHGGHHGGWGGTPWAGWGRYGDPYAYEPSYVDTVIVPVVLNQEGKPVFLNEQGEPEQIDVFGMVDTGAWQRQMNTLKQVPVSVAKIMVRSGSDAIARAKAIAAANSLPGGTARDNVGWKLQWHAEQLAKLTNLNAMYGSGDDLKKWVLAAYVEANAAEEGALWIAQAWTAMWSDIALALANLPKEVAKKVNETAGALLGMPFWIVAVAGLGIVGLGVYVYAKAVGTGHGKLFGGR